MVFLTSVILQISLQWHSRRNITRYNDLLERVFVTRASNRDYGGYVIGSLNLHVLVGDVIPRLLL